MQLVYTGPGTEPTHLHSDASGATWPVSPPSTFVSLVHHTKALNGQSSSAMTFTETIYSPVDDFALLPSAMHVVRMSRKI